MSDRERTARVRALAKINLDLRVLHRRPDGYHELRSVFQTISLSDSLEISFRPGRQRALMVESQPEIAQNLVDQAARLLMEQTSLCGEVNIRLRKRIPMGAGLGGGSSDAAAVLLALPVLAGVPVKLEQLLDWAGRLGSDVPYFLFGGKALVMGRGCEVYPLPEGGKGWAVVTVPGLSVSTAQAYQELGRSTAALPETGEIQQFQAWVWGQTLKASLPAPAVGRNDFEAVLFRRYPALASLKRKLSSLAEDGALVSGSGSALFALFCRRAQAEQACRALGQGSVVVSLVSRAAYRSLWQRWLANHCRGRQWPPRSRYLP